MPDRAAGVFLVGCLVGGGGDIGRGFTGCRAGRGLGSGTGAAFGCSWEGEGANLSSNARVSG